MHIVYTTVDRRVYRRYTNHKVRYYYYVRIPRYIIYNIKRSVANGNDNNSNTVITARRHKYTYTGVGYLYILYNTSYLTLVAGGHYNNITK